MVIFGSQHGLYVYMVQQVLFRNLTNHVKGTLHDRSRTLPVFEHAILVILLRRTIEADGEGEMIPYKEFHHLPCQQRGIGRYVEYDLLRRYMVFLPRKREHIFHQRFQQGKTQKRLSAVETDGGRIPFQEQRPVFRFHLAENTCVFMEIIRNGFPGILLFQVMGGVHFSLSALLVDCIGAIPATQIAGIGHLQCQFFGNGFLLPLLP